MKIDFPYLYSIAGIQPKLSKLVLIPYFEEISFELSGVLEPLAIFEKSYSSVVA
jgi:hypothetical protein